MTVRWSVIGLLVAVCVGLAIALVLRSDESKKGPEPYDHGRALDISKERLKSPVAGVVVDRVTFSSSDGERVPARFIQAVSKPHDAGPCLVFMNGFGTRAADAVVPLAGIARAGVPVLVMDARLNGEREPTPGARAESIRTPGPAAAALRGSVVDVRRALDVLGTQRVCEPSSVAVVGSSQGAIVMTMVAAMDTRVTSSVLLMPSPDAMAARTALRRIQPDALPDAASAERVLAPLMPDRWLPQIDPGQPVLLMRAARDQIVPIGASKRLFELARRKRPQTELRVSPGGHEPFVGPGAATVVREVVSFLSRSLNVGELQGITAIAAATPVYKSGAPLRATTRSISSPSPAVRIQRLKYTSSDGKRVPAIMMSPAGKARPARNCLVAMGGAGTSAPDLVGPVGVLTAAGVPALLLDARLNGERATKNSSLADALRDPVRAAGLIGGTVVDVRRAIDYLEQTGRCRRSGIALVGLDEGAYIMLAGAGADDRVRTAVVMTSSSPPAGGTAVRPAPVARVAIEQDPTPPESWVQMIARDGGVLALRGTRSDLIPVRRGERFNRSKAGATRKCVAIRPQLLRGKGSTVGPERQWLALLDAGSAGWNRCKS